MPFYLTMPSVLKPTGAESRYGPGAVIKMREARSVLLDLTADGDVFVPDRRLGRSRRLIDSFFPPFACVAPDQVLCFHLSLAPLLLTLSLSSHFRSSLSSFFFSSSTFSPPSRTISSLFRSPKEALRAPPSSFVFLSGRL